MTRKNLPTNAGSLAIKYCTSDIEVADFVAIDLEFSGLFLDTERGRDPLSLEDYFKKCAGSIPNFLPLQLGICCGRCQPAHGETRPAWELRCHEFNLWTSDRRLFTSDLQSLRFLRAHGFDFNSFFETGHSCSRLPAKSAHATGTDVRRLPPSHMGHVIDALRNCGAPIIVHNGFLDVLHILDKFIGDLPQKIGGVGAAWKEAFTGPVFDTRLIANEGRYQVFQLGGSLSLEALHSQLRPSTCVNLQRLQGKDSDSNSDQRRAHGSSAYDALLTAEVFLMEMDVWIRSSPSNAEKKRRKIDGSDSGVSRPCENNNTERGLHTPVLLETHDVCRRFHNRLAIVGASPGFLDF